MVSISVEQSHASQLTGSIAISVGTVKDGWQMHGWEWSEEQRRIALRTEEVAEFVMFL